MMLRGGLLLCLLLLWFAHGAKPRWEKRHGRRSQHFEMYFSRGIHLVVRGTIPVVPKIHMLLPTSGPSGSGPSAILCVVTGLQAGAVDITWSINHVPVQQSHTSVQAERQRDGSYGATALLFLSEADWSPQHTYRCTVAVDGAVYRAQARPDSCWS